MDSYKNQYLTLSQNSFLKKLEKRYIYNRKTDSLYELNKKSWDFFLNCDGSKKVSDLKPPKKSLQYALDEGLLELSARRKTKKIKIGKGKPPSLRYLLIELTTRCNLTCKHCYLGKRESVELSFALLKRTLREFGKLGGLRAIFSGGEPLLYSRFNELNKLLTALPFRSILLTNGLLLSPALLKALNFQEIQVSLDGLERGHEALRGKGTFKKTLRAIEMIKETDFDLSIATMIHRQNIKEFSGLKKLIEKIKPTSWMIDVPTPSGSLEINQELLPPLNSQIIEFLSWQFGAEVHESGRNDICGTHLACLKPYGYLTKCGFYEKDWTGGSIWRGLAKAWQSLPRMKVSSLACQCDFLADCKGGCRFRAEVYNRNRYGPDPVKCLVFGLKAFTPEGGERSEN